MQGGASAYNFLFLYASFVLAFDAFISKAIDLKSKWAVPHEDEGHA